MSSRAAAVPHMAMASRSLPASVGPFPLYISTPEAKVQPVSPRLHLKSTCKSSEDAAVLVIYSCNSDVTFRDHKTLGFEQLTLWRVPPRWTLVWHVSAAAAAATWLRAKGPDREVFQRAPPPQPLLFTASLLHPCGGFPLDGNRKRRDSRQRRVTVSSLTHRRGCSNTHSLFTCLGR